MRKANGKSRTLPRFGLQRQEASVALNDAVHRRQPEAVPLALG